MVAADQLRLRGVLVEQPEEILGLGAIETLQERGEPGIDEQGPPAGLGVHAHHGMLDRDHLLDRLAFPFLPVALLDRLGVVGRVVVGAELVTEPA